MRSQVVRFSDILRVQQYYYAQLKYAPFFNIKINKRQKNWFQKKNSGRRTKQKMAYSSNIHTNTLFDPLQFSVSRVPYTIYRCIWSQYNRTVPSNDEQQKKMKWKKLNGMNKKKTATSNETTTKATEKKVLWKPNESTERTDPHNSTVQRWKIYVMWQEGFDADYFVHWWFRCLVFSFLGCLFALSTLLFYFLFFYIPRAFFVFLWHLQCTSVRVYCVCVCMCACGCW